MRHARLPPNVQRNLFIYMPFFLSEFYTSILLQDFSDDCHDSVVILLAPDLSEDGYLPRGLLSWEANAHDWLEKTNGFIPLLLDSILIRQTKTFSTLMGHQSCA